MSNGGQQSTPLFQKSTPAKPKYPPRIAFLDEVRGFCVFLMVIYHALYTVGYLLNVAIARRLFVFFAPVEPLFAGIFIFLCGLCCTLSHSNRRRGGILALVAAGVSVVMALFFPNEPIWFGVLHLLATCILLYAALARPLARVSTAVGLAVCAALFVLCFGVPVAEGCGAFGLPGVWQWAVPEAFVRCPWLYPLGLGRLPGAQADYFPLLPWMFCFFAGSFAGRPVAAGRAPQWMTPLHLPPLAFLGRHALAIYLLHQPLIFGIGWAIQQLLQT